MIEIINNNLVTVNKFTLKPKQDTGFHLHKLNYVIVPVTNGKLTIIDKQKQKKTFTIKAGIPYYREAGIYHNVINEGDKTIIFVEIELKK